MPWIEADSGLINLDKVERILQKDNTIVFFGSSTLEGLAPTIGMLAYDNKEDARSEYVHLRNTLASSRE